MTIETLPATRTDTKLAEVLERVLIGGDLARLTAAQRLDYYQRVTDSLGLNPLTKPLEYITLNGKLTLYARKDATDQLRRIYDVSITDIEDTTIEGIYRVKATARMPSGRSDFDIGAVPIMNLKGDALANAMKKAITQAKRRVTLSICGLGFLDETEVEQIADARSVDVDVETGEIREQPKSLAEQIAARREEVTQKASEAARQALAHLSTTEAPVAAPEPSTGATDNAGEQAAKADQPIPEPAPARMVQCESRSPLEADVQCRREQGHSGVHKTPNESWSDPQ